MIIGVCDADMSLEWLSVLFVYKGVVLLAGLFVAFESRKVTLVSLNESRYVAMSIYGAIIVSIALTPIGLLLEEFPNAQYGILGIMIILCVTIILGLVFVTKVGTLQYTCVHSVITGYEYYRCTNYIRTLLENIYLWRRSLDLINKSPVIISIIVMVLTGARLKP